MNYNEDKVKEALAKMSPEERIKYLEQLSKDAEKELQETQKMLRQSQELLEKNKTDLIKQAIADEQKMFKDQERKRYVEEQQKKELSALFEKEEKDLEGAVQHAPRLPESHKIVGVYNKLQELEEHEDVSSAYMQTSVQELRKEVVEIFQHYKHMPDQMKEIADATYRLTKELLGEDTANRKKYFP